MLLLFVGATFLASLTPGPVVLLTIAVSLRSGPGAAFRAIAGVCTGSSTYLAVALAGLLAILVAHRAAFHFVQLAGALYLIYLGVRLVLGARAPGTGLEIDTASHEHSFLDGLITQISNPKAILYWTALLPPFIDPSRPVARQLAALGAIGIGVDVVVLGGYAFGAAAVRRWLARPRFQAALNATAGALFIGTGLSLALATWTSLRGG